MNYRVLIRKNNTNECRWYDAGDYSDPETIEFLWSEGNYSCDCNRGLFWARANNEADPDRECGISEYDVIDAETDTGEKLLFVDSDVNRQDDE